MTVLRVDHSLGGWVAIPRAAMEDPLLDAESIGVLAYLLVKPHNWEVRPEVVQRQLRLGRSAWSRVTQQLVDAGYYSRVTKRNSQGHFRTEIVISPVPAAANAPGAGLPAVGEPTPGEPTPGEPTPGKPTPGGPTPGGPTPGKPAAGAPIVGEPAVSEPCTRLTDSRSACTLTQEFNTKENNNDVVVISADFFERGLLEHREAEAIQKLVGHLAAGQQIADEVCGAVRSRGRTGERGIRNVVLFTRAVIEAGTPDFSYAMAEADLRLARSAVAARSNPSQSRVSRLASPVPESIRQLSRQIREGFRA